MCNLYSIAKGQRAIIEFARAMRDTTGNLPPIPDLFAFRGDSARNRPAHIGRDGFSDSVSAGRRN
jgi:hypothetical protein